MSRDSKPCLQESLKTTGLRYRASAITVAFMVLFFACGNPGSAQSSAPPDTASGAAAINEEFVSGLVKSATQPEINSELKQKTGILTKRQLAEVEVQEGSLQGKTFTVSNEITDNPAYNIPVKAGQEVVLSIVTENGGKPEVNIADYKRLPALMWLGILFVASFLFFGGRQGLKSLAGLAACVALIAWVLLPLSLSGVNPLLVAVGICLAAASLSLFFVAGLTKKSAAAVIGTIGGITIAGISAQLVIHFCPLSGLSSEEAQILRGSMLYLPPQFYSGLLAAGMLIGALGVIMDVGISISSAVWEVSRNNVSLSESALYKSGMNVGRDIMGTMTNTLVLAYAGGALPLLLLGSQMPWFKLFNLDLVATEIAAALAGSLGLIFTIPLTALSAARLMCAHRTAETPVLSTSSAQPGARSGEPLP